MRKFVSLCLCIAMLVSCFSGMTIASAADDFAVDTLIECEAGKVKKELEVEKEKTASGGKYVYMPGSIRVDTPDLKKPDISWSINIPEDGVYKVYLKSYIADGGKDSYHIWWDDGTELKTNHPGESTDWKWIEACSTTLTAGVHKLNLTSREPGSWWDAVFVTTDASKLPKIEKYLNGDPSETVSSGDGKLGEIKTIKAVDGSAMIEAEDVVVDSSNCSVLEDKAAVGKKAVKLTFDDRNAPANNVAGGMQFDFEADDKGNYNLWARMVVLSGGMDSGWVFTGKGYSQAILDAGAKDETDYKWIKLGVITSTGAGSKVSVRYRGREIGAKIDRFMITNNVTFAPTGEGRVPQKGEIVIVPLDETRYPTPTIKPTKGEHPRLLFKKEDIPTIKENMEHPQNAGAKKVYEASLKRVNDIDEGNLGANTGAGNYKQSYFETIEALAFDYAINGNKENGELAIKYLMNLMNSADFNGNGFITRYLGHTIFVASEVYDWCHDLLTDEDKKIIVSQCESMGALMEMGWPPVGQGAVCGHGGEAQLLRDFLSLGIATYDEYPDIYNFCAGRILSEYLEPTEYWYKSHTHHQGTAYGQYRWGYIMWAENALRVLTDGEPVFTQETPNVGYFFLYTRRPDGQLLRIGDDFNETNNGINTYWRVNGAPLSFAANLYGDEYLKDQYFTENKNLSSFGGGEGFYTSVMHILVNDVNLGTKPVDELPLTKYFGSPNGTMIARTGWNMGFDSPDVLAYMKVGETWGANHDHLDAGTFQLYYKGILASESGWYESYGTFHDGGYNKKTIAHNALIINDPDEVNKGYNNSKDGGQRFPNNAVEPATMEIWMNNNNYERAEVIGHEYGPDLQYPEYSYLAGDITKAYSAKVDKVLRSMLFVNTHDADHPGVMVVMDKVTSANEDFKKSWLLHMQEEPKVDGNKTYVERTENGYGGRMVNETLLPKDAKITKIGGEGKQFMIGDTNYALEQDHKNSQPVEDGWGRVEVSPASANKTDYFLNVMTVSDAGTQAADIESKLIEGDNYAGAIFNNSYAAVFAKDSAQKISDKLSFTIPGDGSYKVFVGGLKAGTWSVNGSQSQVATEEGGCIWFETDAGVVEISYAGDGKTKEFADSGKPYVEGVGIMVSDNFIYSDVPPTIQNGRTLVPMRAIFEALGATVSWDADSATATAELEGSVLKITENAMAAYLDGEELALDVPAQILNGRFVVPVRFVSESFNAKVNWDEYASIVYIIPGVKIPKLEKQEGYAYIISSSSSEDSAEHFNWKSYDLNPDTLWSAQGEHYVDYVFDKEYTIDAVEIMLNQNSGRDAKFEVLYSTDGVNYTSLYDGKGNGKVGNYKWEVFEFEPVTAKFFRYFAKGSNISMWNGLQEIRFREAK